MDHRIQYTLRKLYGTIFFISLAGAILGTIASSVIYLSSSSLSAAQLDSVLYRMSDDELSQLDAASAEESRVILARHSDEFRKAEFIDFAAMAWAPIFWIVLLKIGLGFLWKWILWLISDWLNPEPKVRPSSG